MAAAKPEHDPPGYEGGRGTPLQDLMPCDCNDGQRKCNMNQYVGLETRHQEFKAVPTPKIDIPTALDQICKYVCGFLNSGGGIFYYGVNDLGRVNGIQESREFQLDHLIHRLEREFESKFSKPNPGNTHILIGEDVKDRIETHYTKVEQHEKIFVFEVCVKPMPPVNNAFEFFHYNNICYVKREGSLQTVERIQA